MSGAKPSAALVLHNCIGCGCNEVCACDGGCSWVRLDDKVGVCSECPHHVPRYDRGDRKLSEEARFEVDLRRELGA